MGPDRSSAVAWIALAAGAAGVFLALRPGGAGGASSSEDDSDLLDAGSLENRLADAETRLEAAEGRLRETEERVAKAERRLAELAIEAARALEAARSAAAAAPPTPVEGLPAAEVAKRAEVEALLARIRDGSLPEDGLFEFFRRAKDLGAMDEALAEMEKYAAAHASDPEAQVQLATAYVAKLMQVPDGMERGTWSNRSIEACERALKLDPENWGAQFLKGMNLSEWPDFLGKQPEAIRTFEKLVDQQERSEPDPGYAETYYHLGNLYRKAGNAEKALEVFRRGLARHPDDRQLGEQIELIEKR